MARKAGIEDTSPKSPTPIKPKGIEPRKSRLSFLIIQLIVFGAAYGYIDGFTINTPINIAIAFTPLFLYDLFIADLIGYNATQSAVFMAISAGALVFLGWKLYPKEQAMKDMPAVTDGLVEEMIG